MLVTFSLNLTMLLINVLLINHNACNVLEKKFIWQYLFQQKQYTKNIIDSCSTFCNTFLSHICTARETCPLEKLINIASVTFILLYFSQVVVKSIFIIHLVGLEYENMYGLVKLSSDSPQ